MPIVQPTTQTYRRFIFAPEDIGDTFYTADGERIELTDTEGVVAAMQAGKEMDMGREIKEGAEKIWVTYRVLNASDMAVMRDETGRLNGGDPMDQREGSGRLLAVKLAVVSWSLKTPPWNDETLKILDSDVLDMIYAWVSKRGVPLEQDPEDGLPLAKEPVALPSSPTSSSASEPNRATRRAAAKKPASRATSRSSRTSREAGS